MAKQSVPHQVFTILSDPPSAYAPVLIAEKVPIVALAKALATAGLRLAYDAGRGALVIEPVKVRPSAADMLLGLSWWNGLHSEDRAYWMQVAHSPCPADAWRAYKRAAAQ